MEAQVPGRSSYLMTGVMCACVLAFGICLILPALGPRRGVSRHLQSLNNLKNLVLAVHNYSSANEGTLPSSHWEHSPPMSWRAQVLPYLDRADMHREYDPSLAFSEGHNSELSRISLKVFDSPEGDHLTPNSAGWARSDYGMVSGPGTVQPDDRSVTLDEISEGDGLGQTLMIVECSGLQLGWAEPRDPRVDRETIGIEQLTKVRQKSKSLISTYNRGTAPVAFADGAARSISNKIDPKLLAALCTINGGEKISPEDYQH